MRLMASALYSAVVSATGWTDCRLGGQMEGEENHEGLEKSAVEM